MIKQNYMFGLSDDPLYRLIRTPSMFDIRPNITEDVSNLAFIVPKKADKIQVVTRWSQPGYIRITFGNYNSLLTSWTELWPKTRELNRKAMAQSPGVAFLELSPQEAFDQCIKAVGHAELSALIDLSERNLALTDALISEINSFLTEFPDYAKSKIDTDRLKNYCAVLTKGDDGNEYTKAMLSPIPKPNYSKYSAFFGMTPEELKKRWEGPYGAR